MSASRIGDSRQVSVDSNNVQPITMKAIGDSNPPMFRNGNTNIIFPSGNMRRVGSRLPGYQGDICTPS
ncbi:hypothetical protein [Fulvimarina sp. MAC8]|uniref:hypothetical protein n=1 Tax=Fulvimarina sp. MAC8 TaxID=3162874 RepID=UPI0032EAC58C